VFIKTQGQWEASKAEITRLHGLLRRARIQINRLCDSLDLMPDEVGELLNALAADETSDDN
jgi:hypothetical protein